MPHPSGADGVSQAHGRRWKVPVEAELCWVRSAGEENGMAGKGHGSGGCHRRESGAPHQGARERHSGTGFQITQRVPGSQGSPGGRTEDAGECRCCSAPEPERRHWVREQGGAGVRAPGGAVGPAGCGGGQALVEGLLCKP